MNIHVSNSIEEHQQEDDQNYDSDSSVYEDCLEEFFFSCETATSGDEGVPESDHTVLQLSYILTRAQECDVPNTESNNWMEDEEDKDLDRVSPSAWLTAEEEDEQEIMVGYVFTEI